MLVADGAWLNNEVTPDDASISVDQFPVLPRYHIRSEMRASGCAGWLHVPAHYKNDSMPRKWTRFHRMTHASSRRGSGAGRTA